ncbi:tetratricopeptide repeat protein [Stackebrandtia nassauensis]|uniref:Tetratricopeptide TPR_4 n=1 Tax=Stackebrandtia nassauensis (strain DSM 44728 / CIP 108903 / NRRL B-16338 / NBRC 102104 / LLR-40K-21) TaxID=446470 RepID=D3PX97_STANL|nr:tetratricopeptide repeat protein [Stackebrandtia nassauensis]ADD41360.1 Tetratricopeptide TPR_4 [Stackebrandtia nassauensis DSM 44728]
MTDVSGPLGPDRTSSVLSMSLDLLRDRGMGNAAPLLKLFACFSTAPIPYVVLLNTNQYKASALFTEDRGGSWSAAVEGLEQLGLVDIHSGRGVGAEELSHVLSMHPLIYATLREDPELKRHHDDYYELALSMLLTAVAGANPDDPDSWPIWRVVTPHALEIVRTVLSRPDTGPRLLTPVLQLARKTGRYLIATGLLKPAAELLNPIVDACESFGIGVDDERILAIRHEVGRVALERGDLRVAETELWQVVEARAALHGMDHPETLASRHKHARAILEQHRWVEAEPLLRDVTDAEIRAWGPEHSDTMVVRHSLARVKLHLGWVAEAEAMLREILVIRYRRWPRTTPETLFVVRSLAQSLVEQDKLDEAESVLREALADAGDRADAPEFQRLSLALERIVQVRQGA